MNHPSSTTIWLATSILLCTTVLGAVAEEPHVALVKNTTGDVTVVRNNDPLPAHSGMPLFENDTLISGPAATAGLVFKDGTLLSVGPASDIVIRNYDFEPRQNRFAFALYMSKGTALYSSGKIGKLAPDAVSIATPRATVGVRGTRFIISAE